MLPVLLARVAAIETTVEGLFANGTVGVFSNGFVTDKLIEHDVYSSLESPFFFILQNY